MAAAAGKETSASAAPGFAGDPALLLLGLGRMLEFRGWQCSSAITPEIRARSAQWRSAPRLSSELEAHADLELAAG